MFNSFYAVNVVSCLIDLLLEVSILALLVPVTRAIQAVPSCGAGLRSVFLFCLQVLLQETLTGKIDVVPPRCGMDGSGIDFVFVLLLCCHVSRVVWVPGGCALGF